MQPNMGILGGLKKFVDIVVNDDNNQKETNCFNEDNLFTTVDTTPLSTTSEALASDSNDEEATTPKPNQLVLDASTEKERTEDDSTLEEVRIRAEIELEKKRDDDTRRMRTRNATAVAIREAAQSIQEKADEKMLKNMITSVTK
jgi:hypothetical protein